MGSLCPFLLLSMHSTRQPMKTGMDKLLSTAEDVSKMQEELEMMRHQLQEAAKDTVITMEKIKEDTVEAEETCVAVQAEEAKAIEKSHAIADDAQRDLNEALPALASLKSLKKNDAVEERENTLAVMKLSDRDFRHSFENAIHFEKSCSLENVGEELDPALDPVLLRQWARGSATRVSRC